MTPLSEMADQEFVLLSTYRRSGAPVAVPVWIAPANDGSDALLVTTTARSGKVKRLRHDPRVELRPCDRHGAVAADAPTVTGRADLVEAPEAVRRLREAIRAKYGARMKTTAADVGRDDPAEAARVIVRITAAPDTVITPTTPVPFEVHASGEWLHGTKADLAVGDLLVPGRESNFVAGRVMNHVYVTGTLDAATWGAELARGEGRGRIYLVEPLGDLEDDPNVTDKRFPGNPTRSYRTREPVRITGEIFDWIGHDPETLSSMRARLEQLQRSGQADIDD